MPARACCSAPAPARRRQAAVRGPPPHAVDPGCGVLPGRAALAVSSRAAGGGRAEPPRRCSPGPRAERRRRAYFAPRRATGREGERSRRRRGNGRLPLPQPEPARFGVPSPPPSPGRRPRAATTRTWVRGDGHGADRRGAAWGWLRRCGFSRGERQRPVCFTCVPASERASEEEEGDLCCRG